MADETQKQEQERILSLEDYIAENNVPSIVASALRHAAKSEKHTLKDWQNRVHNLLKSEVK
ncbi:hypothetical protein [Deinococcus cellulosilyticus]|uniref:Uncharacterized protein n=1 Tax=Deinococcus cellulosilyticus (strain DSM 18568 / NBRC 106333 / KACC 11606 / 5516J-15) TaxID=1223518 RepID=A0A511N779_DEIC1|nr:hypothetical protein [Deinococcus cellulosilyticus]GEM48695.1 hypothetical protein DC3_43300 [Deinococcus cellulosilyticus NBRC 106333 = KACC 11606]